MCTTVRALDEASVCEREKEHVRFELGGKGGKKVSKEEKGKEIMLSLQCVRCAWKVWKFERIIMRAAEQAGEKSEKNTTSISGWFTFGHWGRERVVLVDQDEDLYSSTSTARRCYACVAAFPNLPPSPHPCRVG